MPSVALAVVGALGARRAPLDAGQQRLPDDLDAALARVVAADGNGDAPAAVSERIELALDSAARSGLL